MKVLVVEDDEAIAEALVELLRDAGHEAVGVPDGRRALEALRIGADTCLILLDIAMPGMDGCRFREEQLKNEALARVPVVLCTADPLAEQRARALGAAGWLRKPLDPGAPPRGRREVLPAGPPVLTAGGPGERLASDGSAALDDADEDDHDRDHEEDVDEATERVRRDDAEEPQHEKNHEDGPEHFSSSCTHGATGVPKAGTDPAPDAGGVTTMALYSTKDFSRLLGTPGFSDALLKQHFELYAGYVKNTNALHDELEASSPAKPPTPPGRSSSGASAGSGTACASTRSTLEI